MPAAEKLPDGLWPVMLTPFKTNNEIDTEGLRRLTQFYIDAGASGLFANCLSSEMFQLTDEERLAITRTVVDQARGQVPVVATGTFSHDVEEAAVFIHRIAETGVKAVILITSIVASRDENDEAFERRLDDLVERTGSSPLGLYECPVPYKRLVSPELLSVLSGSGRFFYHKDTSCESASIEKKVNALKGTNFNLYNADTPTSLDSLTFGASGISPIAGNFYPELYSFLLTHYKASGTSDEVNLLHAMLTLMDRVVHTFYPFSAKVFLQKRGLRISTQTRIPIESMLSADRIRFDSLYDAFRSLAADHKIELVL